MIRHFGVLDADFQREYGICLWRDVWTMPWRRFLTLVGGLSSKSGWFALAAARSGNGQARRIAGGEVDSYFRSLRAAN